MTYSEALALLYARVPLGMRLGLSSIEAACARYGHPERAFRVVHVAGTNGKGSVCAMAASMLTEAGIRAGLYTSPHLIRFSERIRVDSRPISEEVICNILGDVLIREPDLSFFEVATLAAFLAFREEKCDVAVLEVGIGGRLDATNVVLAPKVSAITRVALDHTDKLGDTLAAIAGEKAGIIKAGTTCVLGHVDASAHAVIEARAIEVGAKTLAVAERPDAEDAAVAVGLEGAHQVQNAAVAWLIGEQLGLSKIHRAEGLKKTVWPGRLEQLRHINSYVLLDGAHNPDGAEALAVYLRGLRRSPDEVALVFGSLADKDWRTSLSTLAPLSAHRYYVEPQGRSAVPATELAARQRGIVCHSMNDALLRACDAAPFVVVCGSLYLVGEARAVILGLERDPPVSL